MQGLYDNLCAYSCLYLLFPPSLFFCGRENRRKVQNVGFACPRFLPLFRDPGLRAATFLDFSRFFAGFCRRVW
jgi:hypothetical protein